MIVSIHQPQYIPWLPYYSKIARSDIFVFLDCVQFQKNGIQNRNELKNGNGRFWLTIPVSVNLGDRIIDVHTVNDAWVEKHTKSVNMNYSRAENSAYFEEHIESILKGSDGCLADFSIDIIKTISTDYFDLDTSFVRQSELNVKGSGSELLLAICEELKADVYLSGPGGRRYLDEDLFKAHGIKLEYTENKLPELYPQLYPKQGFINDLSGLDFVLNVGADWSRYFTL